MRGSTPGCQRAYGRCSSSTDRQRGGRTECGSSRGGRPAGEGTPQPAAPAPAPAPQPRPAPGAVGPRPPDPGPRTLGLGAGRGDSHPGSAPCRCAVCGGAGDLFGTGAPADAAVPHRHEGKIWVPVNHAVQGVSTLVARSLSHIMPVSMLLLYTPWCLRASNAAPASRSLSAGRPAPTVPHLCPPAPPLPHPPGSVAPPPSPPPGGEDPSAPSPSAPSCTVLLEVGDMKCGGCSAAVKRMLLTRPEVAAAAVNLITETAAVTVRCGEGVQGMQGCGGGATDAVRVGAPARTSGKPTLITRSAALGVPAHVRRDQGGLAQHTILVPMGPSAGQAP